MQAWDLCWPLPLLALQVRGPPIHLVAPLSVPPVCASLSTELHSSPQLGWMGAQALAPPLSLPLLTHLSLAGQVGLELRPRLFHRLQG
jgi:hypothetical protein